MKISKYISVETEVDVNVTATDIAQAINEGPNKAETVLTGINNCAAWLKGVPDSAIDTMNESQRKIICTFLTEQASRFMPNDQAH